MKWRLLELTLPSYADMSLTLRPTLMQSANDGLAENTLAVIRFERNSLLLTYYPDPDKDVDLAAAAEAGVVVKRGIVGGGPIYSDSQAIWCGTFLERGVPPVPAVDELTLVKILCSIANEVSDGWKVPMRYRPLNDGEVWDAESLLWRKVLAASSTGMGKIIQTSFISQVKAPDTEMMSRLITPPPEKFQDKAVKSVKQRAGSLEGAVGRPLSYEEVRDVVARGVEKIFGISFYSAAELSPAEKEMMAGFKEKYDNQGWLFNRSERKFGPPDPGAVKAEAVSKAAGGPLVRVTAIKKDSLLQDVLITGSLHASPVDAFVKLEQALKGIPLSGSCLEDKISEFYKTGVATPGITPSFLVSALKKAMDSQGSEI